MFEKNCMSNKKLFSVNQFVMCQAWLRWLWVDCRGRAGRAEVPGCGEGGIVASSRNCFPASAQFQNKELLFKTFLRLFSFTLGKISLKFFQ